MSSPMTWTQLQPQTQHITYEKEIEKNLSADFIFFKIMNELLRLL